MLSPLTLEDFGPSWLIEPAEAEPEPHHLAAVSPEQLRRLRRLISNRESARRCRMRKQRRLEELRAGVSRLKAEKRELADRLSGLAHRCLLVRRDNDLLRAEASALCRRLAHLRRVLALRYLHRPASTPTPPLPACYFEQAWASLIT